MTHRIIILAGLVSLLCGADPVSGDGDSRVIQPGDVTIDGEIGTADIIQMIAAGKYERRGRGLGGGGTEWCTPSGFPDPVCNRTTGRRAV